ncbi:MAG: sulfotransferase [Woeseiaceae bacterium]|nr:sulfotransferase [Woeseiaceae bacterium]
MTSADGQQALAQAVEHAIGLHMRGNLQEAEKAYRSILGTDPNQPDALHYLGVIGLQVGRFDEAAALIERAVEAKPDYVDALVNLGNAYNSLGRFADAVARFEQALANGPETAPLLANFGAALAQLGRHAEAVKRFEAALALEPGMAEARRALADSLAETGKANDALKEISQALKDGPRSIAMQVSLGNALHSAGRSDEAIRCFGELLDARPDLAPVRGNLANVLRQTGKLEEAIEHYRLILEQDPKHVESYHNLGLAWQDLGDKAQALENYRKAVELDPRYAKAWHGISAVSKPAFDDQEVEALLALERAPETPDTDRMRLGFSLGKHFENTGRHAEAAEQYLLANPLQRAVFDYDIEDDRKAIENLRARFSREFIERWSDAGVSDEQPIFIVGMPRSGTTLIEQILASHPHVHGAGELTLLARAIISQFPMPDGIDYTAALEDASVEQFQTVARHYLDGLPDVDAERITDKLPYNFLNVGMIRILFPNAAIVHCKRSAHDTCFSIYKNLFGAYGHFYAYDLEELGRYYKLYESLMEHWESVMPGVIHTVQYEAMIDDHERTARELIAACGLEWDPACLEFYKLDRPVATLSSQQVRQPVYRGSVEAWKNYADMLAPLTSILER